VKIIRRRIARRKRRQAAANISEHKRGGGVISERRKIAAKTKRKHELFSRVAKPAGINVAWRMATWRVARHGAIGGDAAPAWRSHAWRA
jgi:hypothetical protein